MTAIPLNAYKPETPTPLVRETPPGAAYPVQSLGPLSRAAEAVQDITQAPPALGAQSALGVAALAAQGLANVETLSGTAPLSLFLLSVAQSGERKSTGDKIMMQPVTDYQRELSDTYKDEYGGYQNRLDIWEARRKDVLRQAKKEGAPADLDALGPEPEAPLYPLVVATDPTIEGITRGLATYRPSLGIFSDEGGMFLGGSGMSDDNKQKTVTTLSAFWDGSAINRTRAGDGASTHHGKRLALHLMCQPIVAAGLLGDSMANGQGFLARFLITEPASTIGTRLTRDAQAGSQAEIDRFSKRIDGMLRAELPLRDGSRNELELPVLRLDPSARELLRAFADKLETAQGPDGDLRDVRPFASKTAEHAARIAGVLTCYADASAVSAAFMADGIALASYYLGETKRLADAATLSKETQDGERLRKWLVESWQEPFISATDVAQWGPFRETKRAKKVLALLEQFHWITAVDGGAEVKGKHRREAYRIWRAAA